MIHLETLDGRAIALNCDQIAWVEACPDTTVHLLSGQSMLVREPVDDVVRRVVAYRAAVLRAAGRDGTAEPFSMGALRTLREAIAAAEGLTADERAALLEERP